MDSNAGTMTDVAVIGGGLAGLTTAVLLAERGARVRLLERTAALGGRAQTRTRDGFRLNLGPHALYVGGAGAAVLDALGIEAAGAPPPAGGVLTDADRRWPLPTTPLDLLRGTLLSWPARLQALGFFAAVARGPLPPAELDFDAWLRRRRTPPRLAALARALLRLSTYCSESDRISAAVAVAQLRQALAGVRYLHGGWGRLVAALAERLEAAGAILSPECAVRAVAAEDAGVRLDTARGETLRARHAVLAVPPQQARDLLGAAASPALVRCAERARPVLAACLDLGLARLPRPGTPLALALDAPRYLSCHSVADDLAPPGGALLQLAHFGPEGGDTRAGLEAWLDTLQPGWRDLLVTSRWIPAARVCEDLPSAEHGGFAGRPGIDAAGPARVHLCGDWVGPTGLLSDASFASADAVARRILADRERQAA